MDRTIFSRCGRLAVLALAIAVCLSLARAELIMVYTINRHGARNFLPKSEVLSESDTNGGPTLLPQGQRECYNAGVEYSWRYLRHGMCETTNTCLTPRGQGDNYGIFNTSEELGGAAFHRLNTLVRSSHLDRTIVSALSFTAGMFPIRENVTPTTWLPYMLEVVPVYSESDGNDYMIRGYSRCDAYQVRLNSWFGSSEFRAKEDESQEIRALAAQAMLTMPTTLASFWNVYDALNVWRLFGAGVAPQTNIDTLAFDKISDLANWLETAKMRSSLAGNLLGGAMLGDIIKNMEAAKEAVHKGQKTYMKLLVVSGHYNTMLGLLAALDLDVAYASAGITWNTRIPSWAATMTWELHHNQDMDLFGVRLVMQDGAGNPYTAIPLPCANEDAEQLFGSGACTLQGFLGIARTKAFMSAGEWCEACNNRALAVCQLHFANRGLNTGSIAAIAIALLLVLVLVVGGALAYRHLRGRRPVAVQNRKNSSTYSKDLDLDLEDTVPGNTL